MEHQASPSRRPALFDSFGGLALSLAVALLVGCSGTQPKQAGAEDDFGSKSGGESGTPSSGGEGASTPPPSTPPSSGGETAGGGEGSGRLNKEQNEQIQIALRRGRDKAVQCSDVVPAGPFGEASVKVTFDGKKGRSVDASVGSPFSGTPMEACIKQAFLNEIVVPFDGGTLDMSTNVKIAAKAGPPADAKKPKK